ncbi:MAG TPA: hypothetical protein DCP91_03195 [Eggerthellaceae bacterium]|nr:hypothetical protein [Eggerthellaceae bacterium]
MIFDRNDNREVIALLGAGAMGCAIVRRIAAGRTVLFGDISEAALERVSSEFARGGYDVKTCRVDALDTESVRAFAAKAAELGPVKYFIDTAGASPNQAAPEYILAHFKGRGMAGFGGTFKNLAIGLATVPQKRIVHGPSFDTGAVFLERVVDVAKAVFDNLDGKMACVNVLNNLSLDCDCDSSAGAPVMQDIGIMASLDPVALDRASLDQIYLSDDPGKDAMVNRIESHDGAHLLDYAESLGLGSQAYELIAV